MREERQQKSDLVLPTERATWREGGRQRSVRVRIATERIGTETESTGKCETLTLGEAGLTTSGLAENRGARGADNDGLGVREDGSDGEAA